MEEDIDRIDREHDLTDHRTFKAKMKVLDNDYDKPCYLCDHQCVCDDMEDCARLRRWLDHLGDEEDERSD